MSDSTHQQQYQQHQQHKQQHVSSSQAGQSSRVASQANDKFRRVEDILDRRNQQQMQQQMQGQVQQQNQMQVQHQCNHEAEIAIMGETLRQHHDTLAEHEQLLIAQRTANVVNAEAVEAIKVTLSSLAHEVKGLVTQVSEWTGSIKILVWIVGMVGSAIVGLLTVLFSYVLSKGL